MSSSRSVSSSQSGIHARLHEIVLRHQSATSLRPHPDHTKSAFDRLMNRVGQHRGDIILDACCGVGESTRKLASLYPDALVIGVDQSESRLLRGHKAALPDTVYFVRADLASLWPLMHKAGLHFARQYLLYPNPWPKSGHVQRRWYAMPCFVNLIGCGGRFEARSNWALYLTELQVALSLYGISSTVKALPVNADTDCLTPFERKYSRSGQEVWRLDADLDHRDQVGISTPS